jgi:hypothetical protein
MNPTPESPTISPASLMPSASANALNDGAEELYLILNSSIRCQFFHSVL